MNNEYNEIIISLYVDALNFTKRLPLQHTGKCIFTVRVSTIFSVLFLSCCVWQLFSSIISSFNVNFCIHLYAIKLIKGNKPLRVVLLCSPPTLTHCNKHCSIHSYRQIILGWTYHVLPSVFDDAHTTIWHWHILQHRNKYTLPQKIVYISTFGVASLKLMTALFISIICT